MVFASGGVFIASDATPLSCRVNEAGVIKSRSHEGLLLWYMVKLYFIGAPLRGRGFIHYASACTWRAIAAASLRGAKRVANVMILLRMPATISGRPFMQAR